MDGIIFDVDGTLWDSTGIIANAWTDYLLQEEHLNMKISAEKLKSLFGRPLDEIALHIFPDCPRQEQLRLIDACCQAEHRALLKQCAPLYEELETALKLLSARYSLYIVSNSQAGYIEVFLEATGFGRYFEDHVCNGDNGLDKGSNILYIARKNHLVSPVYVGDTMGDYEACKKAGVPFIFASYGFGQVPKPDAAIKKPIDLVYLDYEFLKR